MCGWPQAQIMLLQEFPSVAQHFLRSFEQNSLDPEASATSAATSEAMWLYKLFKA